jgi:ribulose-phosphate 3-epimerase
MAAIAVSAFAADFASMGRDIDRARRSGADTLHVDVMDGRFVPALGLGPAWLRSMGGRIHMPLDIHLMTRDPAMFAAQFTNFGVRSIVFHVEAAPFEIASELIARIKGRGTSCGLAISPGTRIAAVVPYIGRVDEILVMASLPGREGARFKDITFDRIRELRSLTASHGLDIEIVVDGGLDERLAKHCVLCGATKIVMGRAFFSSAFRGALVRRVHRLKAPDSLCESPRKPIIPYS